MGIADNLGRRRAWWSESTLGNQRGLDSRLPPASRLLLFSLQSNCRNQSSPSALARRCSCVDRLHPPTTAPACVTSGHQAARHRSRDGRSWCHTENVGTANIEALQRVAHIMEHSIAVNGTVRFLILKNGSPLAGVNWASVASSDRSRHRTAILASVTSQAPSTKYEPEP